MQDKHTGASKEEASSERFRLAVATALGELGALDPTRLDVALHKTQDEAASRCSVAVGSSPTQDSDMLGPLRQEDVRAPPWGDGDEDQTPSPRDKLVVAIVAEHLVMLFKVFVDFIIPDTPTHVAKAIVWQEMIKESQENGGRGSLLRSSSASDDDGEDLDDDALYKTWSDEDEPDDDEVWDNERDSFDEMSVEKRRSIVKRRRMSASEASGGGSKAGSRVTLGAVMDFEDEIL